jgi:hypothetical protein
MYLRAGVALGDCAREHPLRCLASAFAYPLWVFTAVQSGHMRLLSSLLCFTVAAAVGYPNRLLAHLPASAHDAAQILMSWTQQLLERQPAQLSPVLSHAIEVVVRVYEWRTEGWFDDPVASLLPRLVELKGVRRLLRVPKPPRLPEPLSAEADPAAAAAAMGWPLFCCNPACRNLFGDADADVPLTVRC